MNIVSRSLAVPSSSAAVLACAAALFATLGCDPSRSAATDAGSTATTGHDAASGGGDSLCGAVTLTETLTVPAGMTLTICAGSTLTAANADVSVTVLGTLAIAGTASSPVKLVGASADPGSWTGLVLDAGGQVTASYLELHGAVTGIAARPGSTYSIDHIVIDSSMAMMVLSSAGTMIMGPCAALATPNRRRRSWCRTPRPTSATRR